MPIFLPFSFFPFFAAFVIGFSVAVVVAFSVAFAGLVVVFAFLATVFAVGVACFVLVLAFAFGGLYYKRTAAVVLAVEGFYDVVGVVAVHIYICKEFRNVDFSNLNLGVAAAVVYHPDKALGLDFVLVAEIYHQSCHAAVVVDGVLGFFLDGLAFLLLLYVEVGALR